MKSGSGRFHGRPSVGNDFKGGNLSKMTFVCSNNAVPVYRGYGGDQRIHVPYMLTARLKVGHDAAEGLGRGLVEAQYIERLQESIHRPPLFLGLRRPRDADRQLGASNKREQRDTLIRMRAALAV